MIRRQLVLCALLISIMPAWAGAVVLVSDEEAALPPPRKGIAMRGAVHWPGITFVSPAATATETRSPFDFTVTFEPYRKATARKDAKPVSVRPESVKVLYLKTPIVDLTPRFEGRISANGIELADVSLPVGTHQIAIAVKDSAGHENLQTLTINVVK